MSAAVMQQLADRWHCSLQEVRARLTAKAQAAGLVPQDVDVRPYSGEPFTQFLTLGVTADDRIALLDDDNQVLRWLD